VCDTAPLATTLVLTRNSSRDIVDCLRSLEQQTYSKFQVLVVDNGSTDDAIATVRCEFPCVTVVMNGENLGFAEGFNRGMRCARTIGSDWMLLLNADTVVDPDCVSKMVEAADDSKIGILGPTIYHANEPTIIQSAGGMLNSEWIPYHRGQNELDQGQYSEPTDVDWVSGCAMLVKTKLVDSIGCLDERFFMYEEELDWCIRARRAGWRILHVPQAKVWHKGVQRDYHPKPFVTYYSTRNRFLMLAKHRAPAGAWVIAWAQTLRTLLSWTIKPKWRMMREHRDAMWLGVSDFLRHRWGKCPI